MGSEGLKPPYGGSVHAASCGAAQGVRHTGLWWHVEGRGRRPMPVLRGGALAQPGVGVTKFE